jgi:hypothetical protein
MKLLVLLMGVSLMIPLASTVRTPLYAVPDIADPDFVRIDTSNKSYSIDLDYTLMLKSLQIVKNKGAKQGTINGSSYNIVRGEFNSADRGEMSYFDAFLVKKRRINIEYENGTIKFTKIHHLLNLECNKRDDKNDNCYAFYGELPFRKKPGTYRFVILAHFDNYTKYYVTKMNIK